MAEAHAALADVCSGLIEMCEPGRDPSPGAFKATADGILAALAALTPTASPEPPTSRPGTRSDARLDSDLRVIIGAIIDTPASADPGEPEHRIVAALDRMVARGQATHRVDPSRT